jgi:hypothetical protein
MSNIIDFSECKSSMQPIRILDYLRVYLEINRLKKGKDFEFRRIFIAKIEIIIFKWF